MNIKKGVAWVLGDNEKSVAWVLGVIEKSVAWMLGDIEKSVAWVLGDIGKSMAWVLGESDKQNKAPEKKTARRTCSENRFSVCSLHLIWPMRRTK